MTTILTAGQRNQWSDQGFLLLKNFYDLDKDILPIKRDVYALLSLIGKRIGEEIQNVEFSPERFDEGLSFLVNKHRSEAALAYDAVKRLPSYVLLASCQRNLELAKELLGSALIGFAPRGYGIRLDHPQEDKYLTQLHQDYTSQLGSPHGVVLWSPLRDVTEKLGPVVLYPGSHKLGILPIEKRCEGSYGLWLQNEEKLKSQFEAIAPEVEVGDLVVVDYLLLHESSPNRSENTRWAMISRYFDFTEEVGSSYGWKGGLAEGNSFEKLHPEKTDWRE